MFNWLNKLLSHRLPSVPAILFTVLCASSLIVLMIVYTPVSMRPQFGKAYLLAMSILVLAAIAITSRWLLVMRRLQTDIRLSHAEKLGRAYGWTMNGFIAFAVSIVADAIGHRIAGVAFGALGAIFVGSGLLTLTRSLNAAHRESAEVRGVCFKCGYPVRGIPKRECPECGTINANPAHTGAEK